MNFFQTFNPRKRVIGLDFGTKSLTVSVVDLGFKPKLIYSEIVNVDDTIKGMGAEALAEKRKAFSGYFDRLFYKYKPELVVPELFLPRKFQSNLTAPINFMLGILSEKCKVHKIKYEPKMPSQWKGMIKKSICDVETLYDMSLPVKNRLPNHALDALSLAISSHPRGFRCVTKKDLDQLILQLKAHKPLLDSISRLQEYEKGLSSAKRAKSKARKFRKSKSRPTKAK